MAKDDYFVLVCKVLCYLYDCLKSGKTVDINYLDNSNKQFAVNDSYWEYIISTMAEEGLIRNVIVTEYDDELMLQYDDSIQITPKGIEYLQENSMMKKAFNVIKEIKDIGFSLTNLI